MRLFGRRWMRAPEPSRRVVDDDIVTFGRREWVAVHTPGHTNDHLCLYSPTDGVFLAGDHVLPTITPHISGLIAGADPLAQFFASLDRMAALEGVTLALPAHGHPFTDLAGRCREIQEHHDERLDTLRQAAASLGDASVVDLSHELFKQRSWGRMAESETYAHLEHLRHAGEMTSHRVDDELHYSLVRGASPMTRRQPSPRPHPRASSTSAPSTVIHRSKTVVAVDDRAPRVRHPSRSAAGARPPPAAAPGARAGAASASSTGSHDTALLTWPITSKSQNRSGNDRRLDASVGGRGSWWSRARTFRPPAASA